MLVVSDLDGLERVADRDTRVQVFSHKSAPKRWSRNLFLLREALKADYLVIHFSLIEVFFFSALLFLIPVRCRLVTVDFFVVDPPGWKLPMVRWSLGRIHRMLVYFRDSARLEAQYGLPPGRFHYIPFKINQWEKVVEAPVSDGGYIFVGGRSRRDFRTLFEAVNGLPIAVKVLTAAEPDIAPHGSSLAGLPYGPNVEVIYKDTDTDLFIELMANARLVVIPIVKDCAIQAGISIYIMAMALRKCVVISEALGVTDVLRRDQACIVPAGDAAALRSAIETLWNDTRRRSAIADAGYAYAAPLGGEDHLRVSILRAVGAKTRMVSDVPAPASAR